jgi:predicted GIY-YIG superfamily endonuclease
MGFWTYMLHCRGGYFYTGHTEDLETRIAQHESGWLPGFASDHPPIRLVWSQEFEARYEALAAERQIKGWSRSKKMALIQGDWLKISQLGKNKDSPSISSGRTDVRGTSVRTSSGRTDVRGTPVTGSSRRTEEGCS